MKRLIVLLLFVLALSGCGREMWLKGEVIGQETDENGNLTAIVTETESHGTVRFFLTEDTVVDRSALHDRPERSWGEPVRDSRFLLLLLHRLRCL